MTRRKRETDQEDQLDQQQPTEQPMTQPNYQPSAADVADFNKTIAQHENRMQALMRQIMNSPYMPTRDQAIQLATTVLTLVIMMLVGPAAGGASAGLIQALVKQLVPLIVAASVHFAADQAIPMKPLQAPITSAEIAPVLIQTSTASQAF